jgi:hypothetical protein
LVIGIGTAGAPLARFQDTITGGAICRWDIGGTQAALANAAVVAKPCSSFPQRLLCARAPDTRGSRPHRLQPRRTALRNGSQKRTNRSLCRELHRRPEPDGNANVGHWLAVKPRGRPPWLPLIQRTTVRSRYRASFS